jgi:hypothetical protein
MRMSNRSCYLGGTRGLVGEVSSVAQQRPQHVDQATGQRQQSLGVSLPFGSLALVEGSRRPPRLGWPTGLPSGGKWPGPNTQTFDDGIRLDGTASWSVR